MPVRIVRAPFLLVVAALLGFLVAAAVGSTTDSPELAHHDPERARLTSLVRVEQERVERLRGVAADLRERLDVPATDEAGLPEPVTHRLRAVREHVGLVAVDGPGVVVELDDAREALAALEPGARVNLNDYIIHSEDVRAVANGLWAAGAEAVAVNGERIIPTTALLCVGNTLLVNGTVHSPPYRFAAIGDPESLVEGFEAHELVQRFRLDAEHFQLGFHVEVVESVELPGYRGSMGLRHALPG